MRPAPTDDSQATGVGPRLTPSALPMDLVLGGIPRFAAEAPWAWRLLSRYAREVSAVERVETRGRRPLVSDAAGESPLVLLCADAEAYVLPAAAAHLAAALSAHPELDVLLPVTNEPVTEGARAAPAFATVTPSLLEEAVRGFASLPDLPRPCTSPRSPVCIVRREVLRGLPPELPLDAVPEESARRGHAVAIDPGAYVHRYGPMDDQSREDLAARVPEGAEAVLDVGCARGAAAGPLRARGVRYLVGIEPDADGAREAKARYDRVVSAPLDSVVEDWAGRFDAVLFGDVLEHLADPFAALSRVHPWLAAHGRVVASVPNLGHWAIVSDLIEGRFDYVPYSLLSGTHLRFFTRASVRELFETSGYSVDTIETVQLPVSPEGSGKLARLTSWPGASSDLETAEFLVTARQAKPPRSRVPSTASAALTHNPRR